MNLKLKQFNPSVDKRFLIVLSGITWSVVGIMLCKLAFDWLSLVNSKSAIGLGSIGIMLSLLIHHFGFLRLVNRNIDRIDALKDKICIFAFQPMKSYLIVIIMITIGIILRHSSIPKPYLSVIYIGFGGAMFLSSIRYFRAFIQMALNL